MRDGNVDFDALGALIEFQISEGIDALVVCGTTGEASVLSDEEHMKCIEFALECTAGRVPVIAGTGSNDTNHACKMSAFASDAGASAVLCVTPYYNRASAEGLVKSYNKIAECVECPIILYNVPSRTGVKLTLPVLRELAYNERIVAIKEASGDIGISVDIASEIGCGLGIYCGNDELTLPVLSIGGLGVISVISNIMPREMHEICRLYFEGHVDEARLRQIRIMPLIRSLQSEINPIPIKTACCAMGMCREEFRLPLCCMCEEKRCELLGRLRLFGLIS